MLDVEKRLVSLDKRTAHKYCLALVAKAVVVV